MKQSMAWFLVCSVSLALGNASVGCGGDDSSPGSGSGGTGGTGGRGGSGGTGGSSAGTAGTAGKAGSPGTGGGSGSGGGGTAGSGGATDSGADSGPATMTCGTMTCTEVDSGLGLPLLPCCPTGETNACGLLIGPLCMTMTPGTTDPRCAEVTLPNFPMPVPGCCTATGVCGAEIGAPLGCNDLSVLTGSAPIPCGPDAGPPPPIDSGSDATPPPPDSGSGTDGGASDTGGSTDVSGDARDGGGADGGGADGGSDASADRSG